MAYQTKPISPETIEEMKEIFSTANEMNEYKGSKESILISCSLRAGSVATSTISPDYEENKKHIRTFLK